MTVSCPRLGGGFGGSLRDSILFALRHERRDDLFFRPQRDHNIPAFVPSPAWSKADAHIFGTVFAGQHDDMIVHVRDD